MANNRRYRNRKPQKVDYYNPPFSEEVLTQSIDILDLRENTRALLDSAHISTIKDVVKRGDKDFYKISTFNKKNLLDVIRALKVKKLFLTLNPKSKIFTFKSREVKLFLEKTLRKDCWSTYKESSERLFIISP